MKLYILAFTILVSAFSTLSTAQNIVISGYVEDGATGEKLIGANIFIPSLAIGTVTNTYGFYSITVPVSSNLDLVFSYIGYNNENKTIDVTKDVKVDVSLKAEIQLETIEIIAGKERKIERETQMSVAEIPIKQIKKVPALLGEVDLLRVLQLLPGVQSGGEGQSGF